MFGSPRLFVPVLIMLHLVFSTPALGVPEKMIMQNAPVPVNLRLLTESTTGCDVLFELNAMTRETLVIDNVTYQALMISGGGISGSEGHPGLPTYSGMVAVPEGYSARVSIVSSEEKKFAGIRVLPVQPDKADAFVVDQEAYLTPQTDEKFTIKLGDTAIYMGQTVVSFTIHPVRYQPNLDLLTVASRLNFRINFVADGKGLSSRRTFKTIPQSFVKIFDDAVINSPSSIKSGTQATGPGTYLVITPTSVESTVSPLVNWRKRQGYNVIVSQTEIVGTSFTSLRHYIQSVYDTVEPPLEYILLVGDADGSVSCPTGTEHLSGWSGETDHYYTTLDGSDYLSDVHIGRLTATDPTQLSTIVSKILAYETSPPMIDDPDWFTRASLVGDPDESGITTIYVNQWLKAQLEDQAFTQVDTIFGGNFPALMHASLNQGVSVFGYRGFYAMSNYSQAYIANLDNGNKMPFAVLPTCDTGSFRTQTNAHSEAFLRAPNGGAIGAIALSTIGTHTRYNNCLYHGIWEGMLNSNDHHMGSALTRGKLELYNNYNFAEPYSAEIWACWANLMGDPATDIWLDRPTTMEAVHPTSLPVTASSVPVTITSDGQPVEGALVALYKADELRVTGYTDASGYANLPISGQTSGTLLVTVTMHNRLPYRGSLALGEVDVFAGITNMELTGGNDDGIFNPGETLDMRCALTSAGTNLAAGVTATLVSHDPLVTVIDGDEFFGDIPAGETLWCQDSFQIEVSPLAVDQQSFSLDLIATNGSQEWVSAVSFTVQSCEFSVVETTWNGQFSSLLPGDFGTLMLDLANTGSLASGATNATLTTESPWVFITDENGSFDNLNPGSISTNISNRFSLQTSHDCFLGHLATFQLSLTLPDGLVRTTEFQVNVGQTSTTDPVGPDSRGYYALDNTDTEYDQAPVFQWLEINPDIGGPGTGVGLEDFAFQQDDTKTIDLPFTFQYYGQEFGKVSICSNGWIAMGETSLKHYRNFSIPSAGSPNAMIAPFWDNLRQTAANQISYYYDEPNGTFIVEWDGVYNYYSGQQKFQVILRDPLVHPTSNGDGEIIFQYQTVNNTDPENGYATVGIQNLTGDDGLLYTYWNFYATGAAQLESGRAILFTPAPATPLATCEASPSNIISTQIPQSETHHTLTISNNGEANSELFYTIEKVDPDAPALINPTKNMEGSVMTSSLSVYPVGEVVDVVFSVTNNSPDSEYLEAVTLDFPLGVSVVSATSLVHSGVQTLNYNQAFGEGAICVWDGGIITSGNTAVCTITIDFTNSAGALFLPYVIEGDNYGGAPHSVEGTISLEPSEASITILSPNGGEIWAIGEDVTISFVAGGGPEFLTMKIIHSDGQGIQTIMENIPADQTSVNWTVEGPLSAHCWLMLSDRENNNVYDASDGKFTIGRNMDWVSLDQYSGTVAGGSSDEIGVTINTTGLVPGFYAVDLVIRQMANGTLVVPIRLEVTTAPSGSPDIPQITSLGQNHPNPFNPQTEIRFSLENDGVVKLKIYNTQGRLVRTLVDGTLTRGEHTATWRGLDDAGHRLSSGMYLYRMETESGIDVRKMSLVK